MGLRPFFCCSGFGGFRLTTKSPIGRTLFIETPFINSTIAASLTFSDGSPCVGEKVGGRCYSKIFFFLLFFPLVALEQFWSLKNTLCSFFSLHALVCCCNVKKVWLLSSPDRLDGISFLLIAFSIDEFLSLPKVVDDFPFGEASPPVL